MNATKQQQLWVIFLWRKWFEAVEGKAWQRALDVARSIQLMSGQGWGG